MTDRKQESVENNPVVLEEDTLEQLAGGQRKAGGNQPDYLKYKLENVIVSSYQTS